MGEHVGSLDAILTHYVGGAGLYQWLNTFAMALIYYISVCPLFLTVFTAYEPEHRCYVPNCDEFYNQNTKVTKDIFNHSWLEFALPPESYSSNYLADENLFDGCKMFDYNLITTTTKSVEKDSKNPLIIANAEKEEAFFCQNDTTYNELLKTLKISDDNDTYNEWLNNDNRNGTMACANYIYDNTYFDETLITKFDLVCDNEYKKSLLGTLLIIGLLFGSLIGGFVGDRFGRKKAIFLAVAIIIPITIGAGHVGKYEAYAFLHLVTMACLPVIWINTYVYSTEIFTPKLRHIFAGIFEMPFGYYAFGLISYLNRTWTGIHIWVGITVALTLPLYFILPESPRWLAQNKKEEEAFEVLLKISKVNGKNLNGTNQAKMKDLVDGIAEESHLQNDNPQKKLYPWHMFTGGQATKTLILIFAWITSCISFYALSLNSADLKGNIFESFFYARSSAWGTIFVYLTLLTMGNYIQNWNWGRTKSLILSHFVLGCSCIILAYIPKKNEKAVLGVYMIGSIFASVSFTLVYLMTSELYPTNLRSQAVGSASAISRIFCACAPFLGALSRFYKPLPMLIVGIPILISGALVFALPETYQEELPPTIRKASFLKEDEKKDNNMPMDNFRR